MPALTMYRLSFDNMISYLSMPITQGIFAPYSKLQTQSSPYAIKLVKKIINPKTLNQQNQNPQNQIAKNQIAKNQQIQNQQIQNQHVFKQSVLTKLTAKSHFYFFTSRPIELNRFNRPLLYLNFKIKGIYVLTQGIYAHI